jgi:hypothetical protein
MPRTGNFRSTSLPLSQKALLSRDLLKRLPKRFMLAWKKQDLQDSIRELRDFVSDFDELTARIIDDLKEDQNQTPKRQTPIVRDPSTCNSLERYSEIRTASLRLYNTFSLRWSCVKHAEHAAAITLASDCTLARQRKMPNGVLFDVAISCKHVPPTPCPPPIFLEVESVDPSLPAIPGGVKTDHSDQVWDVVMSNIHKANLSIARASNT